MGRVYVISLKNREDSCWANSLKEAIKIFSNRGYLATPSNVYYL